LAEELGDLAGAQKALSEALKLAPAADERGARIRAALGRVLLKATATSGAAPRPVPPATRTSKLDLEALRAYLTLALIADDLPRGAGPSSEAEKLADEVLAMGDKAPFDARAQALAIKGLYTRALREYTTGLRDSKLLAPRHANELLSHIDAHPAFKNSDVKTTPDPLEGERLFAAGLRLYTAKRYPEAEREFAAAIENDANDARYIYYLGLARLMQGNRDGLEDFDRAARLERTGRPDRAAVSAALERVQGPVRETLNAVRNRPLRDKSK
jgi:tetratricopeptide (TPR) repeat protein